MCGRNSAPGFIRRCGASRGKITMTRLKRLFGALCVALMLLCASPAAAAQPKRDALPDVFNVTVQVDERKEEGNRYFIAKEYVQTVNPAINADLQATADALEAQLRPTMQPDKAKNARRNSRLDVNCVYTFTGDRWLSTLTLGRVSYQRQQVCSPFVTRTYDLVTGQTITLGDLFAEDSPAWALLSQRVRTHVGELFPNEPRNPSAVEALAAPDALRDAPFTLSAMELTLHYQAQQVYPGKPGLMHVRFFYDELWDDMTPLGRAQTDNRCYKMVAVTCDDGPAYNPSANALDAFRRAGARVTYFTVGKKLVNYGDILLREFDENHLIASHSYDHWSGYTLKPASRLKQLDKHNALLLELVGERATLFRAPGGTFPPWVEAGIGLPVIQWSVDTYDYTGKNAQRIFYSVRNNVQHGDIILAHDSGAELWKAVPIFAEYLHKNGYLMVTVEELARAEGIHMEPNQVYYRFADGVTDKRSDSNT